VLARLDGVGEFAEDRRKPMPGLDIHAQFVVAATEVLNECVPGTDHSCQAKSLQATHRPLPGLQTPVIGFDGVIGVPLDGVASGGQSTRGPPVAGAGADRQRADVAGQVLAPVPGLSATTAAGLARRFTDAQWRAVETGIGEIGAVMLARLPPGRAMGRCCVDGMRV
jgi:hypothetical protein